METRRIKTSVTILTGSDELNSSLDRYLRFVMQMDADEIFMAKLGHPETMEPEMSFSDLWVTEAFNPDDSQNPEGFRTTKKFAGKAKALLLFTKSISLSLPKSGRFWLALPSSMSLASKIKEILSKSPPSIEEYQMLEKLYPLLKEGPSHHHHIKHK